MSQVAVLRKVGPKKPKRKGESVPLGINFSLRWKLKRKSAHTSPLHIPEKSNVGPHKLQGVVPLRDTIIATFLLNIYNFQPFQRIILQ